MHADINNRMKTTVHNSRNKKNLSSSLLSLRGHNMNIQNNSYIKPGFGGNHLPDSQEQEPSEFI